MHIISIRPLTLLCLLMLIIIHVSAYCHTLYMYMHMYIYMHTLYLYFLEVDGLAYDLIVFWQFFASG